MTGGAVLDGLVGQVDDAGLVGTASHVLSPGLTFLNKARHTPRGDDVAPRQSAIQFLGDHGLCGPQNRVRGWNRVAEAEDSRQGLKWRGGSGGLTRGEGTIDLDVPIHPHVRVARNRPRRAHGAPATGLTSSGSVEQTE